MPSVSDSAYPRLKSNPCPQDLQEVYTPNEVELLFAEERTRQPAHRLGLLLLLKTFQRLGYFARYADMPAPIVRHIADCAGLGEVVEQMEDYDADPLRHWHAKVVLELVGVTAYGKAARQVVVNTCFQASRTRDDLPDIINMAIEELIRQRYELPAFSTLLRIARTARSVSNRGYQKRFCESLDEATKQRLLAVLSRPVGATRSLWEQLKQEPKRSTVTQLKERLHHLRWLQQHNGAANAFEGIPEAKVRQFAAEARSLDLTSMNDLPERKRLTLVAALILKRVAQALDDIAGMFIRQVNGVHNHATEALTLYRVTHAERTDALIEKLRDVTLAYKMEGSRDERFGAIESLLEKEADDILDQCTAHTAIAENSHLSFLPRFYRSRRSALFLFLAGVPLVPTTQDQALSNAVAFMLVNRGARGGWLKVAPSAAGHDEPTDRKRVLDLSFVPEKWWRLVTGERERSSAPARVDRRYFELCVLSEVRQALKSGDLCIPGSEDFSDYRKELVSEDEYQRNVALYGEQAGIPVEGTAFIGRLREELETAARAAADGFQGNEYLRIENGKPILKRLQRLPDPPGLRKLEQMLDERIEDIAILDALFDTEYWLNWTRPFGPISGLDAKLTNPRERYIITTFCYGCDLGPTQTARSIRGLDRRDVSYPNRRHVTEGFLDDSITTVINGWVKFPLQRLWGPGKSAAADGTQWEMNSASLMSEYHIRYGGYGGIGYYMVSDSYIAIFSRFSTCGAWEGHYILDFVNENKSDVQPDVIHADTQGQSTAIFGLAYLLGIQLMPRIRNWKDLHLYRPSRDTRYEHIDALFSEDIDWELIETMLPDMLRVALSVKAGTIMPSTILRRLATYSRKNKLYFAFRELGRVVRTIFLLKYVSNVDLRHGIQAATNKCEAFNKFLQWVGFGGEGIMRQGARDEQRKFIKYNHLVANLLAFHTMVTMTRALAQMHQEGHAIDLEALAVISPYRTKHLNRFGDYAINANRTPPSLEHLEALLPSLRE